MADQVAPPRPPERARHHPRQRLARAAGRHRALQGADGLGRSPGTRSPTTSTPTSASTSGTGPTPSTATTTTGSSAPTSSTAAATRRWAPPGPTSTSPRSAARRSGRTRPRATRRPSPTCGGASTTSTTRGVMIAHVGGVPVEETPAVPSAPAPGCRRSCWRARLDRRCACVAGGVRAVTEDRTLRIERTFQAPAEAVFDAWTSEEVHPALVARRQRLGDDRGRGRPARRRRRTRGDARPRTRTPSTAAAAATPRSTRRRRLAFTWIWDRDTRGTLIEIDFEEAGGVTTVRFTHSGLWDEEAVRSHEGGMGPDLRQPRAAAHGGGVSAASRSSSTSASSAVEPVVVSSRSAERRSSGSTSARSAST